MVTSTSLVVVRTIPTAFRSPNYSHDSSAYYVRPSGDNYSGNVGHSYGNYRYNTSFRNTYSINPSKSINGQADYWWLRSPNPDTPNDAYLVDLYGDVDYGGYTYVGGSYGNFKSKLIIVIII